MRLSPEQRRAAAPSPVPVRVVAGAGTGKTAVLAERFRALVAGGADPASILVLTFTERAAWEMAGRMLDRRGDPPPNVGTFHSQALRWLREDSATARLPRNFEIESGVDRWIALRELMWEMGDPELVGHERPDELVGPLLKLSERLKQELVDLGRLEAWCASAGERDRDRARHLEAAVRLLREHGRRQRARRVLEFDDLLVEAVRLLETAPAVLARYRARFRHVMVDEYQDTNLAQERLVELIGGGASSLLVAGDDDQSIYRFRGASLASMERFVERFPAAVTRTLGTNRRSGGRVVAAAAALIEANAGRLPKALRAAGRAGPPVTVFASPTGGAEADEITRRILAELDRGTSPEGIAVLSRTHAAARPVAAALREAGVPVRHTGAGGTWHRPHARDVLALLRLVADPSDVQSALRLLDRLGADLEAAARALEAASVPALRLLAEADPAGWPGALLEAAAGARLRGVDEVLFDVLERTGFLGWPHADPAVVAEAVDAVADAVDAFCSNRPDQSLAAFLARVDLVELAGADDEPRRSPDGDAEPAVQVMSIHQAKGLEFEVVFVPGLVEGRLPQPRRHEPTDLPSAVVEPGVRGREDHVAEERRLLYVAMTRARGRLVLSWAGRYEGARAWSRSRFLDELETAAVAEFEVPAAGAGADAQPPAAPPTAGRPGPALSFSAIAAYRECPRQSWFRTRVRPPVRPGVEAQYGVAVHAALMDLGRAAAAGRAPSAADAESAVARAWEAIELVDERRRPALEKLSRAQVGAYVDAGGFENAPARVEERFVADLGTWRLSGAVDRVDAPAGAGAPWRIVDYKTGTPLPASRLRRDLQLALYALGARTALGLDGDLELDIVYLRTGRTVSIPASDELLESARAAGEEVAAGVEAGIFPARPERRRCGLCPYRVACAESM